MKDIQLKNVPFTGLLKACDYFQRLLTHSLSLFINRTLSQVGLYTPSQPPQKHSEKQKRKCLQKHVTIKIGDQFCLTE